LCDKNNASARTGLRNGCPSRNRQCCKPARCTIGLHRLAAENPLQICCRISEQQTRVSPTGSDSSSKTNGLELANPDAPTGAREIRCLFLADAANREAMTQPLVDAAALRRRRAPLAIQIEPTLH
jgi:hypothetical protein